MKDKILKLAKVKSEKEFYHLFPTQEAFMAKYGGEFKKLKKAELGIEEVLKPIQGMNIPSGNPFESLDTKTLATSPKKNPFDMKTFGGPNIGMEIGKGIVNIIEEGKKRKKAQQWANVSDVVLQASQLRPEEQERKYVRPEDTINSGGEFFPIYGVGTNPLARNGKNLKKAFDGEMLKKIMPEVGASTTKMTDVAFQDNAGYELGKSVGSAVKYIPGVGPVVSAIAEPVLGTIGGLLDPNQRKIRSANKHIEQNMNNIGMAQNFGGVQQQYTSFMRTGGNIRENSNMDGDLKVYDGEAEMISYNPYSESETVMFRGPSHEDGGMPISYGNSLVEVEGREPAIKMNDGGEQENLVVFGNLQIPKNMLQDRNANGKKFKNYIADLSKIETKNTKILDRSTKMISDVNSNTSFDKLHLSSLKANILGANMQLKDLAAKKEDAAALQNAINTTAEEHNLVADDLAMGKIKQAKKGIKLAKEDRREIRKINNLPTFDVEDPYQFNGETGKYEEIVPKTNTSKFPWMKAANELIPLLRPSDAENLDPRQLAGEMYAMSNNQLEPVYAQTFQPELTTPYNISLQDILNENQSDFRATQKLMQNNPAALAALQAQKYGANQKVLGEQFRMNQGEQARVFEKNRDVLNQSKLQNLGILDKQQEKQSLAKSNTKAITQKALESISSKYLQNKLENKTLQTYENLYNYRFDEKGRAINMNAPYEFNMPQVGTTPSSTGVAKNNKGEDLLPIFNKKGDVTGYKVKEGRNGAIVSALKKY